ncbi:hypothetical protein AMATHDRAFT_61000 [Amanita thiersii Skay4041]|uniref:Uncharacterized protein n=1 Tax=Amanita thiersii Skay4041 TaxID=703135 RepID=A0A2A9NQD1_9AGAR|nr:hypothetical protein AMATHDRAFT_61000 [Amanita thiersii Skay4041]
MTSGSPGASHKSQFIPGHRCIEVCSETAVNGNHKFGTTSFNVLEARQWKTELTSLKLSIDQSSISWNHLCGTSGRELNGSFDQLEEV